MIKKARIKNYQSHRNTTIELSSGITGIIGDPLSGKTPILRAINWLINGRPSGFKFHSRFTKKKKTSVSLELDNGTTINKTKSKSKGRYKITNPKGEKSVFTGNATPDIIQEKLNISEINIHEQLDGPFLITSPPGLIAKTINKATKIDEVDDWIKKINSKIFKRKTILSVINEDTTRIKKEIRLFKHLEKTGERIRAIKKIDSQIESKLVDIISLKNYLISIKQTKKDLKEAKQKLKVKDKIKSIEKIEAEILLLEKESYAAIKIKKKRHEIEIAISAHKVIVKKYIKEVKKEGKCPTCYGSLTDKVLKRIQNKISIGE